MAWLATAPKYNYEITYDDILGGWLLFSLMAVVCMRENVNKVVVNF